MDLEREIRTRDILLAPAVAELTLKRREWSRHPDLNRGPAVTRDIGLSVIAQAPGIGDCMSTALPPAPHACQPAVWFTLHWTIRRHRVLPGSALEVMLGCDIGVARRRFRTGARRGAPGRRDCH
jgi:hypothetical protein